MFPKALDVPIRKAHVKSKEYPEQSLTFSPRLNDPYPYMVWSETDEFKKMITKMTFEDYLKEFPKNARLFDLHGHAFQDFALKITSKITKDELRKWSIKKDHPLRRLVRARVYAISTRPNIGWDGNILTDETLIEEKKQVQESHLKSLKLYDWCYEADLDFLKINPKKKTTIQVQNIDTQSAVVDMYKKYPNNKICWLDLAAGHNVCGAYSVDHGGSQEEEVATNCDVAALLGTCAKGIITEGLKSKVRGHWVQYKDLHHIPPGGNYFGQCRFITGEEQVECHFIATAFADFRPYAQVFVPYSELLEYYTVLGTIKNTKALEDRLMLDMRSTLVTAVKEKMDVLVLGAGGMGAFWHDPQFEVPLWKRVLTEFDGYFDYIIFAVLDKPDGKNITAFQKVFGK